METVIEKWSKDISGIRGKMAEMNKAFDVYANQFRGYANQFRGEANAMRAKANGEANAMRAKANAMNAHIWGTQEAKEAWQKKYGR